MAVRSRTKLWQRIARQQSAGVEIEQDPLDLEASEAFPVFVERLTRNMPPDKRMKIELHQEVWVQEWVTGKSTKVLKNIGGENVSILAPRGSGKSSLLGMFVAWAIGHHAKYHMPLQILYISNCLPVARDKSAAIKGMISSPEYQAIFPNVAKGSKWSDQFWAIDPYRAEIPVTGTEFFSLMAAGITGAITSKRCHIYVLDDIIKSAKEIASKTVRDDIVRNIKEVIKPTMFEGGRGISIGTRFRADDVHVKELIAEKKWKVLEQSALLDDEDSPEGLRSYWEDMWSTGFLVEQMENDPIIFSFQYQNKVKIIEGGISIHPTWIHWETPPKDFDRLAVGIDFAVSEQTRSCYTAMMLVGEVNGRFCFLDYRRGKWVGNIDKIDVLLDLVDDWKEPTTPVSVFAESVAYQASFKGDFTSYAINQKQRYDIQIIPSKMEGDKIAHILSVSGIYANGLVTYNRLRNMAYPIFEMTGFMTEAEYDDCMDASVIVLQGLGIRRKLTMI